MVTILIVGFSALFLYILFGPYRLRIRIIERPEVSEISIGLTCQWAVYGMEWRWGEDSGGWRGLLLGRSVALKRRKRKSKKLKTDTEQTSDQGVKKARRKVATMCLVRKIVDRIPVIMKRLLGSIHILEFRLHGDVGFEDPALTGQMYGLIQGAFATGCGLSSVSIHPRFDTPALEGEIHLVLGFVLIQMIWTGMRTAASMGWAYVCCRR